MLYTTIDNAYQLRELFQKFNRDCYSWETYKGIFNYYEDFGMDCEVDVIGLCCELSEETEKDVRNSYDIPEDVDTEDFLWDHTTVFAKFTDDNGELCYSYISF